ncbi:hypothetical protein [Tenacibaculum sp. 190524A02b]
MASSVLTYYNTLDPIKIIGKYEGFDEMGYSFSFDTNGEVETITFEKVKKEFIIEFKLDEEITIGKKFEIIYSIVESEDDEDYSMELILESLKLVE